MPKTLCRLSLTIPEDLYELYAQEAEDQGKTIDEVVISRLYTCRGHDSSRPLYFNDQERSELESLTGGRILPDAKTTLLRLANQVSLLLDNTKVKFSPALLNRLKSRCGRNQSFSQFVRDEAIKGLERYAMMR